MGYHAYAGNYPRYLALAQEGMQHLRTAATLLEGLSKNPFDSQQVAQAQSEFTNSLTAFDEIDNGLHSFSWISPFIPVYGSRLGAAFKLLSVAIDVSQAGVAACKILNMFITRFHDPLSPAGQGLTMSDIKPIDQEFRVVAAALHSAIDAASQIQPADLQFNPQIGKLFATVPKELPILQTALENADMLLTVMPTLLGIDKPATYMLEVLDSTELRPGGGFIGNYGFASFSGGKLVGASVMDVSLLEEPFQATSSSIPGVRFPFPPAYSWFGNHLAAKTWSLRDSNLDPDFPLDAQYGELNYLREGGKFPGGVPIQGMIAITPALIEHALEITGPIAVPEYHETVTAQNLISRIHYYQLGGGVTPGEGKGYRPSSDGLSSQRKHFTALLALHFLAHVRQLPTSALPKLLQLLVSALRSKDLQIYFNSNVAESVLNSFHLDAAIRSPVDDGIFVVDANMAGNKANRFITSTLDDHVYIDKSGNAVHHTTISYSWVIPGKIYPGTFGDHYLDYARVYLPLDSTMQLQNGWRPYGAGHAFGQRVWGGYVNLDYGQIRTITLVWTDPFAAQQDGNGWYYNYLLQRQAGSSWMFHLQITLPSCSLITNTSGGLVAASKQAVMLSQTLDANKNLSVNYTC